MMHGREKSDAVVVAAKPTNKAGKPGAELVEPSDPPPLKWSALRYVLERKEKADGKKAVQAGGDCCKAPAG